MILFYNYKNYYSSKNKYLERVQANKDLVTTNYLKYKSWMELWDKSQQWTTLMRWIQEHAATQMRMYKYWMENIPTSFNW